MIRNSIFAILFALVFSVVSYGQTPPFTACSPGTLIIKDSTTLPAQTIIPNTTCVVMYAFTNPSTVPATVTFQDAMINFIWTVMIPSGQSVDKAFPFGLLFNGSMTILASPDGVVRADYLAVQ